MTRYPYLVIPFFICVLGGAPLTAADTCGDGAVDANEDCDNGGLCVGGANAGTPCTAETDCAGDGACLGGAHDLRGCRGDADCREGRCVHCRPYGGDGCASNCTAETDISTKLADGGAVDPPFWIADGTSGAIIYGPIIGPVPLPFIGRQTLTLGRRVDGVIPVAIRANTFSVGRIPVSTIACACVRGAVAMTCGGIVFDVDGQPATNCTPNFVGPKTCPEDHACAPVFGPSNAASGFIACGRENYDLTFEQDCGGTPGGPPGLPCSDVFPDPGPPDPPDPTDGAALITIATAIGTVVGRCTGSDPAYGPDGQFCTNDDALANRGIPGLLPLTTGTTCGTIFNPAGFEGDVLGPIETRGEPFTCTEESLAEPIDATLAGVLVSCNQPALNDTRVAVQFVLESPPCAGDCDGDGETSVDELMRMVNIGLGTTPASTCPAADVNGDARSTVDEILEAVTNALEGCSD